MAQQDAVRHFFLDCTPFFILCILYLLFPCQPLIFSFSLSVQEESKSLSESRAELEQQLASSTSTVAILQTEKAKLQTEVQESKKEQDDLLMLLADQDQKIHSLKQKLKDLGEPVDFSVVFLDKFISFKVVKGIAAVKPYSKHRESGAFIHTRVKSTEACDVKIRISP